MKGILPREKFLEFNLGHDTKFHGPMRFNGKIGFRQTLKRIERKFGLIESQFVNTRNGTVIMFTRDEVIFVKEYDGEESLSRAPRNPEILLRPGYRTKGYKDDLP